ARVKLEAESKLKQEIESAAQKEAEIKARLEAEIRAKLEAEILAKQPPAAAPAPTQAAPKSITMPPKSVAMPPKSVAVPPPKSAVIPPKSVPAVPAGPVSMKAGPLVLNYGEAGPRKQSWSIEIPLVPTYNFETMIVGANRFAHAAGMSVIESPGTMYNPLVLHGPPSCGKSHLVHAIAYGMSKDMGQQNVFVTDGVRFSRGVLRLSKEGKLETLDKTLEDIKALFIDDIHLMSVNDENKVAISKWLNQFAAKKKQIVLTSLYPPKNLARLESALGFQLNQGWIVELKPSSQAQIQGIVQSMVARSGIELSEENINRYLVGSHMPLGRVADALSKVRIMSNISPRQGPPNYPEMLAAILGTSEEDGIMLPTEDDIKHAQAYVPSKGNSWGSWGFFYPKGMQQYVPWMINQICEKMKELGVGGGFDASTQLEYDAANLMVSAFRITDACSDKGLRGAVVLLPPEEMTQEAMRKDFAQTVE
ncbi:MAG TPA: DnaA/Hda family protein, partial [Elusimicrobiales bacterium]|nr:DnaA/Hda family protein [Elusimicrobiales bacterium]